MALNNGKCVAPVVAFSPGGYAAPEMKIEKHDDAIQDSN